MDSLLEEFAGELNTIPPRIHEADFDPEEDIRLILLYDDCTSSDDNSFENIDYIEASPPGSELVSLEEVKDDILRQKLLNIYLLIAKIESLNDNPTPDCVLKSPSPFPIPVEDSDSFFKKSDTSLSLIRIILYPNLRRLAIIRKRRVVAVPLLMLITLFPSVVSLLPFSSENEEKVFNPGSLSSNEEKSPHLLSHRGFNTSKIISDFSESPMMMFRIEGIHYRSNGYSLKDKNEGKTDKTEHENGKSVPKAKSKSASQKVKVKK
ncbi:hypothetical protein Tco_1071804 [Tanacetum coccineum]